MDLPHRAPVRPRIAAPCTGEPILLEDYVATQIERQEPLHLKLCGGPGVGKSTAIRHLAATRFDVQPVCIDDRKRINPDDDADPRFVVRIHSDHPQAMHAKLLPWTNDDVIEYLLSLHGVDVGALVARSESMDLVRQCRGNAAICRLVIDTMRTNPDVETVSDCIRIGVRNLLGNDRLYHRAQRRCLGVGKWLFSTHIAKLFLLNRVQIAIGADRVVYELARYRARPIAATLSHDLLDEVAVLARREGIQTRQIEPRLSWENGSFFAGLMIKVDPNWRPEERLPALVRASLPHVKWSEADLTGIAAYKCDFRGGDFSGATIHGGNLKGANLSECNFSCARISRTEFPRVIAEDADFHQSNLSAVNFRDAEIIGSSFRAAILNKVSFHYANLSGCCFADAELKCKFTGANLSGVDFRGCCGEECRMKEQSLRETLLSGSSWINCEFEKCDLEFVQITDAVFRESRFCGSYLSGSRMRDVDFREANLSGTGLADIDWQGVDLRGADLSRCAFHMGSSRSGLVGSPYPGHGSKTGFYTNDYDDVWHRPVEEIRKANLSGADLRGANIYGTDFYLVDLRAALYDPDQYEHFVRCDAILTDRRV